jgi:WD40 repeat protein
MIYTLLYAMWLFTGSVRAWTQQTPSKHQTAAVALNADGAVVAWGHGATGADTSGVANLLTSGVVSVYSTLNAFAALKDDGSVVVWGNPGYGGVILDEGNPTHLLNWLTIVDIIPNDFSFTAIANDGTIFVWGNTNNGGTAADSVLLHCHLQLRRLYRRPSLSLDCYKTVQRLRGVGTSWWRHLRLFGSNSSM